MKFDKKSLRLYAVTDRRWLQNETLKQAVEEAITGGSTFIQLREKDLDEENKETEAVEIQKVCHQYHVPFVIDDDVELAKKIHADGVHVGQSDMACTKARAILGKDAIVGVSAGTVEEAIQAEKDEASYLGVGAVFPTGSKDDAKPVSYDELKKICAAVQIPVIAIGGITRDNVQQLSGSGIVGVAVISAIFAKKDIRAAAADLKKQVEAAL